MILCVAHSVWLRKVRIGFWELGSHEDIEGLGIRVLGFRVRD